MPFSRRDVLRNAAMMSLATVADTIYTKISSAQPPSPIWPVTGIRIFFEGPWIFCADPTDRTNTFMRAVTLEMAATPHFFTYGVWPSSGTWNEGGASQLTASNASAGAPAMISLGQPSSGPVANLGALFTQAQALGPLTYIPDASGQSERTVDWQSPGLRVVSLPIPTRIIPAAIRTDATLQGSAGICHPNPDGSPVTQVATTHIFEYQGADGLTFSLNPSIKLQQAQSIAADFHLHTAPQASYGAKHGPMMFAALIKLLEPGLSSSLSLGVTEMQCPKPIKGPSVPAGVDPYEVGIPLDCGRIGDFATCGSGSIAIGKNP